MATVLMPSSWAERNTRVAISLRFATSSFLMGLVTLAAGIPSAPGEGRGFAAMIRIAGTSGNTGFQPSPLEGEGGAKHRVRGSFSCLRWSPGFSPSWIAHEDGLKPGSNEEPLTPPRRVAATLSLKGRGWRNIRP